MFENQQEPIRHKFARVNILIIKILLKLLYINKIFKNLLEKWLKELKRQFTQKK